MSMLHKKLTKDRNLNKFGVQKVIKIGHRGRIFYKTLNLDPMKINTRLMQNQRRIIEEINKNTSKINIWPIYHQ